MAGDDRRKKTAAVAEAKAEGGLTFYFTLEDPNAWGSNEYVVAVLSGFRGDPEFGEDRLAGALQTRGIDPREVVGYAIVQLDTAQVLEVEVVEDARRRGIANSMYDAIERHYRITLEPSDELTADGVGLWERRQRTRR